MSRCYLKGFKKYKQDYYSLYQTANEHIEAFKYLVENDIPEELESCTTRNLNKVIQHALRLQGEFCSFARERRDMDQKELRVLFIKNHVSELLLNANKHAKIFETEKEDKTNKKHIYHINEMLQYTFKITKVYLLFNKVCMALQRKSLKIQTSHEIY